MFRGEKALMKILILEDDAERMKAFAKKLQEYDFDYTDNAQEAIEYLKKNNYNLIYLDHDLGGKQLEWDEDNCGMTVAEYIAEHPLPSTSRVVIHSFNVVAAQRMLRIIPGSVYIPGVWTQDGVESGTTN